MIRYKTLICARSGSKGLPGKNIKLFNGKPLIAHSIEIALSLPIISDVFVSTDDVKIAKIAQKYGASIPFIRPQSLASDEAKEWDVWKHSLIELAKTYEYPDALVVLPPTSPLRKLKDIKKCIKLFEQDKCDGVICVTNSSHNPEYNMVKMKDDKSVEIAIKKGRSFYRRQDAPSYFNITTVCYIFKSDYIMSKNHMMSGNIKAIEVDFASAVDIDTQIDFSWAEFISTRKN